MIYALDTSVLLDVFMSDPVWNEASRHLLESLAPEAEYVISPEVYAELAPYFPEAGSLDIHLESFPIEVVSTDIEVARIAGPMWSQYRRAGGPRSRIVTDFIVAAHALVHSDALVTRDDGFFRQYFVGLQVLTPAPLTDASPDQ